MDTKKFENISQAIQILGEANKSINVNRVHELTGISSHLIGKHPEMQAYLNPRKTKPAPPARIEPGDFLDARIESYASHIQSNYFDKPQTFEEARWELVASVRNFSDELYKQAFSKLVFERILIKQGHTERYQKAPAPAQAHVLIEVQGVSEFFKVREDALDSEIATQLQTHPGRQINIYRLSERASSEIRIVRAKLQ